MINTILILICISLSSQLIYFKKLLFIIIFKLNKSFYDILKVFYFIVFLNILRKLIHTSLLLLLSCMVVPIGNLVNKLFSSSNFSFSTMTNSQAFSLPTVFPSSSMEMDFLPEPIPDNHNEVRGRNLFTNSSISRDLLMSSTKSSVTYHEKIVNNSMDINEELVKLTSALFYETEQKRAICISKMAEQQGNMRLKDRNLKIPNSNSKHVPNVDQYNLPTHSTVFQTENDSVINIQLLYNPQAPTEPDFWSGNFHLILLHSSIKQIASDVKNIKDSLNFMARYISNKKVNPSKANELENFNGISNSIQNFISSVYQANWDSFHTNNQAMTLRVKISSKFTPRITLNPSKSNKEIAKHILVTIEKIPPSLFFQLNQKKKSMSF